MTKQGRRQYTEEFKREAVKLVDEPGRGIAEVARSLGVHRSLVERWRGQCGQGSGPSKGGELKRLRAEVKQLRMEREILKNPPAGRPASVGAQTRLGIDWRRIREERPSAFWWHRPR